MRYEIVDGSSEIAGSMGQSCPWWSVVAYDDDGTCIGGDAHWVRRSFAEAARDLYVSGDESHGSAPHAAVVEAARRAGRL